MDYQWDPKKADLNNKKHGIDFADAVAVFEDEWALTDSAQVNSSFFAHIIPPSHFRPDEDISHYPSVLGCVHPPLHLTLSPPEREQ